MIERVPRKGSEQILKLRVEKLDDTSLYVASLGISVGPPTITDDEDGSLVWVNPFFRSDKRVTAHGSNSYSLVSEVSHNLLVQNPQFDTGIPEAIDELLTVEEGMKGRATFIGSYAVNKAIEALRSPNYYDNPGSLHLLVTTKACMTNGLWRI